MPDRNNVALSVTTCQQRRIVRMENEEEYFTYKEANNDLGKCMNDLRESHKFCDFIIRVGEEEIKTHKIDFAGILRC